MTAREAAVARVLVRAYGRDFDTDDIAKRAVRAADRADTGCRKLRSITTYEEIEALPDESIIRDSAGDVAEKRGGVWCSYETAPMTNARLAKYTPVTVIHEPVKP